MNTSVSVVYYTSKTLKNGNHPLMLRVTQNRKPKYVSLGINIHPNFWDTKKNKPKTNCPNYMAIQRLITDKIKEYTDNIIDLQIEKKDFTAKSLIDKVNNPQKKLTVGELFQQQIAFLKKVAVVLGTDRLTNYTFRHSTFTHKILQGANVMQLAKEGGTHVNMLEKHYFNHTKK